MYSDIIVASSLSTSSLNYSTKATKSEEQSVREPLSLPFLRLDFEYLRLIVYTISNLTNDNDCGYSKDKGEYLIKKFGSENFSYVIVEDLENENGFDEAVKGVDAIEHTASPFHFKVEDPHKDLINPAVNGTLSVLKSALKNGDKVQRIVSLLLACKARCVSSTRSRN